MLNDIIQSVLFFFVRIFTFLMNLFIGLAMTEGTYHVIRLLIFLAMAFGAFKLFGAFFTISAR